MCTLSVESPKSLDTPLSKLSGLKQCPEGKGAYTILHFSQLVEDKIYVQDEFCNHTGFYKSMKQYSKANV